MPEDSTSIVGAPDASYVRPLLYGLPDRPRRLDLLVDFPSKLAIALQKRAGDLRCAFLSPIDYARHGGDYLIVPGICVASRTRSDVVKLYVNTDRRDIETVAVDIRVTSEIILAKIVLTEKFPNLMPEKRHLQFIPMLPNLDLMLQKADAALIVNFHPEKNPPGTPFSLDLVEEWNDLTGLPYVHGIWVGHDGPEEETVAQALSRSKVTGLEHLDELARSVSTQHGLDPSLGRQYLDSFTYELGDDEQEGLTEFIRYAYYHGVLPDAPELNFFDLPSETPPTVN